MKQTHFFVLWGGFFIVCAGLGFIPQPEGMLRWLMTGLSVLFFLPGGLLLYRSGKAGDMGTVKLVRNLSALSLGLTVVFLLLNFLSVFQSAWLGTVLYYVLIIVSSPMVASGHWAMSLFLWACLLMGSLKILSTKP